MALHLRLRTVLNTAFGCTFMAKEQGIYGRGGRGRGGCESYRGMGQHCGKTVTWLKIKIK